MPTPAPALTIIRSGLVPAHYIDMAGDVVVALLLMQIIYWYRPSKAGGSKLQHKLIGHYWIAKSRDQWMAETGLTPDQYRRAVKVLRDKGLIVVRQLPFHGRNLTHIRLVTDHSSLVPKQTPHSTDGDHPSLRVGDNHSLCTTDSTEETTSHVLTNKSTTGEQTLPETGEETDGDSIITGETEDSIQTAENTGEIGPAQTEGESVKAEDIVKQIQGQKGQTSNLGAVWQSKLKTVFNLGFQPALTGKQKGQLKLLKNSLGDRTVDVLDYAINHWMKFASRAGSAAGTLWPADPHIGFLLTHHGVLVQMMDEAANPAPDLLQSIAPPVAEVAAEEPSVAEEDQPYHLTQEELDAMIAGLKE